MSGQKVPMVSQTLDALDLDGQRNIGIEPFKETSFNNKPRCGPALTKTSFSRFKQPCVQPTKPVEIPIFFLDASMSMAKDDHRSYNEDSGAFLRVCFLCKKQLAQDSTLFMYGSLRAFCSPQCREMQMELETTTTKNNSSRTIPSSKRRKKTYQ
ncbi:Zf-FLZ domain [Dillenia turbinata]|uniref:Zf-FLZ domain n=1 Tax=Dillenia turbinata TaxID=194707 RepID=A0AAN8UTP3_9MAGN